MFTSQDSGGAASSGLAQAANPVCRWTWFRLRSSSMPLGLGFILPACRTVCLRSRQLPVYRWKCFNFELHSSNMPPTSSMPMEVDWASLFRLFQYAACRTVCLCSGQLPVDVLWASLFQYAANFQYADGNGLVPHSMPLRRPTSSMLLL